MNWGIIGVGQITYKVGAALKNHAHVNLSIVYSRSPEKAQNFANDFTVQRATSNLEELWSDDTIDAVYIATPNHTHKDFCLQALQAGKHVLCEKPLAMTSSEVREIIAAQEQRGRIVMEAMWTRFLPIFDVIRSLIKDGKIGKLIAYEASLGHIIPFDEKSRFYSKSMGGGALLDLAVYPLSLAHDLFGDIEQITSTINMSPSGVEDEAILVTHHPNGILGDIKVSFRRSLKNDMIIYGEKARIEINAPLYRPQSYRVIWNHIDTPTFIAGSPLSLRGRLRCNQTLFTIHERFKSVGDRFKPSGWQRVSCQGNGYGHQIDAFLVAAEQGKTMVDVMPLTDSIQVIEAIEQCR